MTENYNIMTQERLVIHLEKDEKHYYFGSLAAIYTQFQPEEIGVAYGTLRNYKLTPDRPYQNQKCIIRKGILVTKPSERGK